jgi:hypothetical protein
MAKGQQAMAPAMTRPSSAVTVPMTDQRPAPASRWHRFLTWRRLR